MTQRRPRVNVTIDRLVLRGFAPEQRGAIAAALTRELSAQLGDPATQQPGPSRALASLRAGAMNFASPATPQAIGAEAGRMLARSIRS